MNESKQWLSQLLKCELEYDGLSCKHCPKRALTQFIYFQGNGRYAKTTHAYCNGKNTLAVAVNTFVLYFLCSLGLLWL